MLSIDYVLRDRYKILRLLGQGGMGAVYEAHDNVFETSVAVKEIVVDLSNAQNTNAQEMVNIAFEREAKLLAKINHETFPHVKDYFSEDSGQFLVMELVDGEDLATLLKQRQEPFPVDEILGWADQLLDGLDYLHTQDPPIIHRDLKPQNLKLNTRGKIKLLDFGIAKGMDSSSTNTITNQTFVAATLNYSPIEQMLRVIDPTFLAVITHKYGNQVESILKQNADVRSDIYALGATLYNLLTAVSPVEAVKRAVDIWDGKPDPLQNPSSLNPKISGAVSEFLLRSMQINRDHRFRSASEMRTAMREIGSPTVKQSSQKTEVMNFAPQQFPTTPGDAAKQVESDSLQTIPAAQISQPTGAEARGFATAAGNIDTAQPQPRRGHSLKLLLLIPLFGLIFLFLGASAFGFWWMFRNQSSGVTDANTNTENVNIKSVKNDSNVDTDVAPTRDISSQQSNSSNSSIDTDISSTPTTQQTPERTSKTPRPRATPKSKTPRPTPKVRKTPRKTPKKKKNMDCIFTDDC